MNTRNEEMKVNILALTVRCTLMAIFALPLTVNADDAEAYALTHPSNSVGFGALYSSQDSAKFGQYNGLNKEGAYGIGNFDIRGGDGYDADKNSALRWKLNGADLGTTNRELGGSISNQGKWKLNLGYDELRHNITDTFQTPLQGNTGGNEFNLPGNFGTINSATGLPGTRALTPNQSNAFHTEQEYTERRNGKASGSYTFSGQLNAQFDYNHLDQNGAKLIGTGSQGGINLVGGSTGRAEAENIIMNPTNYTTDNVNATLNWTGNKGHLTGGYYGSMFYDKYNSLSWQNAVATGASGCSGKNCDVNNTMSTAPSNSLHQANLSGGYNFSSATKLAGGFSYSYNSQNSSYAPTTIIQASGVPFDMMRGTGLPSSSLNGQVATTHGDLKLTNQSIKDLTLSAGFKFNQRDNYTNSNIYKYFNIAGIAAGNQYTGINTPYSNSKSQYEAAADYRLTNKQKLRLAYERENIKRWCNQVVGGAQCIASPSSNEDKVSLGYRLKAFDDVNFNAGYSFAKRNANLDHNYLANSGNYALTTAVSGSALNGGDYLGFAAYPYANRNQNMVKTGVNWQATQKLDMGLNGRYTYDSYDQTLGVQSGRSLGVNFDTTYSYAEKSSISGYWSWQNGQRNLVSGATGNGASQTVAPTNVWANQLEDNGHAFGFLTRNGGLLNNKLEIIGDFSYSIDKSSYSTQVPYLATCGASGTLSCGDMSSIKNGLFSLKLTGNYTVHKNGRMALAYIYQQLSSNDYFYNSQQFGFTPNTLMPTGLQPQSYRANVVALSYNYNF